MAGPTTGFVTEPPFISGTATENAKVGFCADTLCYRRTVFEKVNMYLHVEGVTGESADVERPQWIDVRSFYWCASQGGNTGIGERAGRV